MTWADNLTRIRRFLRDPAGNIWSDALCLNRFNAIQKDLQRRLNILDAVEAVHVPPRFDAAYLQDWEWPLLTSTQANYQALRYHEQADTAYCYRWEPQAVWGLVDATAPDEGIHVTQPWEAWMGETPGECVPLQYPRGFHNAKWVAYDKEPIEFITLKSIQQDDPSWVGRMGSPFAYWRPDKNDDYFCLYPIPSDVPWEEDAETPADPDWIYACTWEDDTAYITGSTGAFTRENADDGLQYIFTWEDEYATDSSDDEVYSRGMWLFEGDYSPPAFGIGAIIHAANTIETSETGTIADIEDLLAGSGDSGIVTDTVEVEDNVLFVFSRVPAALADNVDESDYPAYMQKYVEYGALAQLYAADTDGQIQSLRDYWQLRYDTGEKILQRYKSARSQDRDYRLMTHGEPTQRTRRQPRLPDTYPAGD